MIVRLGYVSISKTLDDITPSHTITYTNYLKESNKDIKLDELIKKNLYSLKELLIYNIRNDIYFYRLTSKLIPLATHNSVNYDFINPYKDIYQELGKIINDNNIRIDTHPDQFAVLNSTNKDIVDNTFNILEYHYKIQKSLNITNPIMILHVGSSVFGKDKGIKRFINNFNRLPSHLKKCIALENDDKIYNVEDVLYICKELDIPFVLDYHHYMCNHENNIKDYLNDIFNTWKNINPKVHFSSPKNNTKKEYRSHHDYVNVDDFIEFINIIKEYDKDIDIMIEAKAKDEALFRLVRQLKYKTDYKFINSTTFML